MRSYNWAEGSTAEVGAVSDIQVYAGFWARTAAYVIDGFIVFAGQLVFRFLLFLTFGLFWNNNPLDGSFLFQYSFKDALLYGVGAIYFVLCTYYAGATLGKKAMNLKVVSGDGERLTFLNVLYRETVGRFLSAFVLCIGYILVGVTNEKTGLHDILCDTRVVYAKKIPTYINGDINKRYKRYEQPQRTGGEQAGPWKTIDKKQEEPEPPVPPVPPVPSDDKSGEKPRPYYRQPDDIYDRYRHVDPKKNEKE